MDGYQVVSRLRAWSWVGTGWKIIGKHLLSQGVVATHSFGIFVKN